MAHGRLLRNLTSIALQVQLGWAAACFSGWGPVQELQSLTEIYCNVQAFDAVKERTSIVPFQAIWEGRQKLPKDYYKEWLRLPYATIVAVTLGTYWAHPLMQSASHWLNW